MGRQRHRWHRYAGGLALTGALAVLLFSGHLSAQVVPGQGSGSPWDLLTPQPDELAAWLVSGPEGQVFRLVQHWTDFQTGGGGVVLSLGSPQNKWEPLLELLPSEAGVTILSPDVAFGPSKEIALAYQWRRQNPRVKEVRVARSFDGGKTWIQASGGVQTSGAGFAPRVAWGRERTLVVAWPDERNTVATWEIFARRSPDGGATWDPEQSLSRFPVTNRQDAYYSPVMTGDGNNRFWVVWVGLRSGRSSVYMNRSIDGGKTWTDPVALSGQSASVFRPRILRSGERLLVAWVDARTGRDRIYAVNSADGGVTWGAPTTVGHVPVDAQITSGTPSMVLGSDSEVFATWQDGRNGRDDIFFARSPDFGSTWGSEDIRLDMDEPGTAVSKSPVIARADDGRLAVAWEDDRAGNEGVYLRVRTAGPAPTWGPEVLVAPPGPKKAARIPSLRWAQGGALHVSWGAWDLTLGQQNIKRRAESRVLFPGKD